VKVEHPGRPDPSRGHGPAKHGVGLWWKLLGRNKRTMTLDLSTPGGRDTLLRLAATADVVIYNFRAGTLEKWGLGWPALERANPKVVFVRISGFGQTGPYSSRAGYGNVCESMGGLRAVTGYADGPPLRVGVSIGDQLASLYAVIGALMALRMRDKGGGGDHVDVALTEAVVSVTEAGISEYVHEGVVHLRNGNRMKRAAPTGVYPTSDGQWVAIGANGDSIFRRFATAVGHPEWTDDPEMMTNRGRVQHVDELERAIIDWTSRHAVNEVVTQLNEAGVPCGPVYTVKEISEDPHFWEREALIEVPVEERDELITMPGVMPRLQRHPGGVKCAGGPIGRDTEAVLAELLRLSEHEIVDLRDAHVICGPDEREPSASGNADLVL